ncbi:MAG: hypothetical protein JWL63_1329 [Rhodocyclales bacterium]|nr:hypothetical protein [Rhodocyclales bacterium]
MRYSRGQVQGYILIATLAILMALGVAFAIKFAQATQRDFDQPAIEDYRAAALNTLEQARVRLLVEALEPSNDKPGELTCPDRNNSGLGSSCSAVNARTAGLFPYNDAKPLPDATPRSPIKDIAGECIWYALSPSFRNSLSEGSRKITTPDQLPVNPANLGSLLYNGNNVVAVLIAPGGPLSAQKTHRCSDNGDCVAGCPLPASYAAMYLESLEGNNNAGSTGAFADAAFPSAIKKSLSTCALKTSILDPDDRGDPCSNDVVLPIRSSDIMKPLIRVVLQKLATDVSGINAVTGLNSRLSGYVASTTLDTVRNADPHGFDEEVFVDIKGSASPEANGCFDSTGGSDPRPLWLCANQWYRFMRYNPGTKKSISITLNESIAAAKYRCDLYLDDKSIACQ